MMNPEKHWPLLCDPQVLLTEETLPRESFQALLCCIEALSNASRASMRERLKTLQYPDFLKTTYWRVIRNYVLYVTRECQLCGVRNTLGYRPVGPDEVERRPLQVHHRTYENHGSEHDHLGDLEAICKPCHQKLHHIQA